MDIGVIIGATTAKHEYEMPATHDSGRSAYFSGDGAILPTVMSSPNQKRVLDARLGFAARIDDLRRTADAGGTLIVQAVVDVIAALNAVVSDSWVPPFTDEFNAWNHVNPDETPLDSLHAAARLVADAGVRLVAAWNAEAEDGRYDDHDLTPAQHEFVSACGRARDLLVVS